MGESPNCGRLTVVTSTEAAARSNTVGNGCHVERVHAGIPVAEQVDHLVLLRVQDVVAHHAVLARRQTGAEAGEGGRRGGREGGVQPDGNVALPGLHDGPQERRVRGLLLEQVPAQAVRQDHADPLTTAAGSGVFVNAVDAEACRGAGEDVGDGALAEGGRVRRGSGDVGRDTLGDSCRDCGFARAPASALLVSAAEAVSEDACARAGAARTARCAGPARWIRC